MCGFITDIVDSIVDIVTDVVDIVVDVVETVKVECHCTDTH